MKKEIYLFPYLMINDENFMKIALEIKWQASFKKKSCFYLLNLIGEYFSDEGLFDPWLV